MEDLTGSESAEQPVVDEVVEELTPEAQAEEQEWDDAADEIYPGLKKVSEEKEDESAKSEEKPEASKTPEADPKGEKPEAERGTGDESKDEGSDDSGKDESKDSDGEGGEEDGGADTSAIDARIAAREAAQQVEAVKEDVRKQLYEGIPTEMRDADGDPIRSVADVMKLIDPRTGSNFTEEAASVWLTAARQQFNEQRAQAEAEVTQVAEVNIALKDEADLVNARYGELLKAMPDVRDKLWAQYQKTLVRGKNNVIVKTPVSLKDFYTTALEPYAELGRKAEADEDAKATAEAQKAEETKKAEDAKRQRTRQDRSDIYSGGKTGDDDPEDKEWAAAAESLYGPRK